MEIADCQLAIADCARVVEIPQSAIGDRQSTLGE